MYYKWSIRKSVMQGIIYVIVHTFILMYVRIMYNERDTVQLENFKGSFFKDFKVFCLTSKILSSNFCQKSRTDIRS